MSFCRITGKSRGLPKPNYFPLLAPISPGDARRFCRITGKSYGLPTHHYIPVLLSGNSANTAKCKITNVAGELGPHHYAPDIAYGNRKHDILPDYRYIFPVLDGSTDAQKSLIELLHTKEVPEERRYVYTVTERRCSLVFSAQLEAAVRDGDVRDVMLSKDSDTVLIKTKQGRNVSMDFKDYTENGDLYDGEGPSMEVLKTIEQEELEARKKKRKRTAALSSVKRIFEDKDKLADVQEQEEEKQKVERITKKAKLKEIKLEKNKVKSLNCSSYDLDHMRTKSSVVMCSGDWRDLVQPLIESWDWEQFEKEAREAIVCPKLTSLPQPIRAESYNIDTESFKVEKSIADISEPLENVPYVDYQKCVSLTPKNEILDGVKTLDCGALENTASVKEKIMEDDNSEALPTLKNLPKVIKNLNQGVKAIVSKLSGLTLNIDKAQRFVVGQHIHTPNGTLFIPGQTVQTPSGPQFVPGMTINTPSGPALLPGHILRDETTNEPLFVAGQTLHTSNGEQFIQGQTVQNGDGEYRFLEGQTVMTEEGPKFIPGKIHRSGKDEVFVPGQTLITPDGLRFIPGQSFKENDSDIFMPGQNIYIDSEWQFVPGQNVAHNGDNMFVPGATINTYNGPKFVPGQVTEVDGKNVFVPGISREENGTLKFLPGMTVETIDGPKFLEGQVVKAGKGEKFAPGKTVLNENGRIDFAIAKNINDISFSEPLVSGLPIDCKTASLSTESFNVFGYMVQTNKGIEFYPGLQSPRIDGKVVPGRLMKGEDNDNRFVPGMMFEGSFVPGQTVFTDKGEQFVPGQVIDTVDGPKFVPGQVVDTKNGPKFVPGQTIDTIDGPRFVPGQIIETKAGPTFIPGQVISTEDEGSRFVPGQVVDTEEGPRFVPGRVIESTDHGVTFVPGQIVETSEGLKFVAPDLTEGDEGLEFSVQSFVVTPEELKLLKIKSDAADSTTAKGELTIDSKMLRQLSEAGMSIGRQVPTDLPAVDIVLEETRNKEMLKSFISDYGLKDEVANQLMTVISSIVEMSVNLKHQIHEKQAFATAKENNTPNANNSKRNSKNKQKKKLLDAINESEGDDHQQENIKNSIAAAVLAAMVISEQYSEETNFNTKDKYRTILKSINTVLGKSIDETFVSAMYDILQTEDEKDVLRDQIIMHSSIPKVELIKLAVQNCLQKQSVSDDSIIEKFSALLGAGNNVLGPAFKNITNSDSQLLKHVLANISDGVSFINTDKQATETLQKAIVSAVHESSSKKLEELLHDGTTEELRELFIQSVGLAKTLGMKEVASTLLSVMNDSKSMSKLAGDSITFGILRRLTVMRQLAEQRPSLHSALLKLQSDPDLARTDPKLRELVRESAALMIVPGEPPLMTSQDVPLSLLETENSLAMEDFLYQRKTHPGTLLIMKKGLQAVVPREASRAVLTGQVAYSLLDETGIRHFEPLHVFSALKLNKPTAHRFSMYSCPVLHDKDVELRSLSDCSSVSDDQRITRIGGWQRKTKGVLLERENTSSVMGSVEHTPAFSRYTSNANRTNGVNGILEVEDVVVATADYTAAADDEVSLKAGDIVEILDSKTADDGAKRARMDPSLDAGATELLDASAAKHKLAVRPRKNHQRGKSPVVAVAASTRGSNERLLVRVLEEGAGGSVAVREGWVPAHVLHDQDEPRATDDDAAFRRQAVVRELVETEEEFGRDLGQVVARYMRPVDKATAPKPVFDNRELLFSNFRQIAEFHNTVLLEGVKYYAAEPRMLGRALLRMEREFDKHVAYCRDEPAAQHFLATNDEARLYFQNLSEQLGDDKTILEHLKLPIQRINDYQLLLKELVKYSKRLGEDCTDLQKALELMLGVPHRATDNKFISSIEGYRGNIYKLGRLLTHDWFTVIDAEGRSKERYLFLFKARILVCKVRRISDDRSVFILKDIIKIPDVEVKDHPGDEYKFELHNPSLSLYPLTLTAHKELVKAAWLKEIRQYTSDVVALAEHAADDLQVLNPTQGPSPEPPKTKQSEESTKSEKVSEVSASKRSKETVEGSTVISSSEISTKEESIRLLKASRKQAQSTLESSTVEEFSSSETASAQQNQRETRRETVEVSSTEKSDVKSRDSHSTKKASSQKRKSLTTQDSSEAKQSTAASAAVTSTTESQESVQAVVDGNNNTDDMSSLRYSSRSSRQVEEYSSVSSSRKQSSSANYEASASKGYQTQSAAAVTGGASSTSRVESSYSSSTATGATESSSRRELTNGSLGGTTVIEQSSTRTAIQTGTGSSATAKPVFSKTIEGCNIEPGDKAVFECSVQSSASIETEVTWLKDNKPLNDKLADRVVISSEGGGEYRLELKHCHESDSGLYTARAQNRNGNSHCSAQLVVQQLTAEERMERNALKAPYFIVALNDTEVMENTYLRFMVKVKGEPNPRVTFYKEGTEIRNSDERVQILRDHSENGFYELVIVDVCRTDAGKYSCKAVNSYGEVTSDAYVSVTDDKNIFGEISGEDLLEKGVKPTFAWKRNGEDFDPSERFKVLMGDDEDSLALVFQHVRPEDAGMYTCVAKTSTGNISCSAELTVQGAIHELHREPEKPSLVIESRESVVSVGASAMLELQCKGYPKPNVVWKHEGKVVESGGRFKFLYEDAESMSLVIKNVTAEDAGTYTISAKNELGEDNTEMHLTVKAAPKIKKKVQDQTCSIDITHKIIIEIEGSPAPEVTFFKDGVQITSSEHIKITKESEEVYSITFVGTKLTDAGSYSVVAKNEVNQCSDFWQMNITSPPKITQTLGGSKECSEGETVLFQIKTEASPAPTVKWLKNGSEVSTESSSTRITSDGSTHTLALSGVKRTDAATYSVSVSNAHGTSRDDAALRVRCAPTFQQRLTDLKANEGDVSIEFIVSVEAYPEPSVKWYYGDAEISEKKSVFTRIDEGDKHKLVLKEVTTDMSGVYSCKVSNELGSDQSSATFTVNSKPRITKSLVDMTVNEGQTLRLEVEVEGCPEPKLKWFKDGKEVTTDARVKIERDSKRLENYSLTLNLVREADGGEYEVRAENEMGSVTSKSTVTVHTQEVHTRFGKEMIQESSDNDSKKNKAIAESEVDAGKKQKAKKIETEIAEEKSFWDDNEDGKSKKASTEDVETPYSQSQKGVTTPEVAEEKSFWDDMNIDDSKKPKESKLAESKKSKIAVTSPEVAEEKSFWDDNEDGKKKHVEKIGVEKPEQKKGTKGVTKPEVIEEKCVDDDQTSKSKASKEDIAPVPQSPGIEGCPRRVVETVTTFARGEEGSIIVSVLTSTRSHDAIITGPAETHTLHKKTTTATLYEDDECNGRKIIQPNRPHKTSLQVEEIESHNYIQSHMGSYTISDYLRRGNHGIVEEPQTDSEAEHVSDKRCYGNRNISIMSVSEDDTSMHDYVLSRDMSMEDVSKSIFDYDDSSKVFARGNYVRQSSFHEEYLVEDGEREEIVLTEKMHKTIERDVTEDLPRTRNITIKNDTIFEDEEKNDEDDVIASMKAKNARNSARMKSLGINYCDSDVTKKTLETVVERRKARQSKMNSVLEEEMKQDEEVDSLIRRIRKQRSILDDILNKDDDNNAFEAPPQISGSKMKDSNVYESLPLVYEVSAVGLPRPVAQWTRDGKPLKPSERVEISDSGDTYKLEIHSVEMSDAGLYKCELSNDLGSKVQKAKLEVTSVNEFRKPIFTKPLVSQRIPQKESVVMTAVCTADPVPEYTWYHNGNEITADKTVQLTAESKDIEHGLKECTFSLKIPTGRHSDTGEYTLKAKNEYGTGESHARLDILLRPEIEGPKDITGIPYEQTEFVAVIHANPIAEVSWSKDGLLIQPSPFHDIVEDRASETFKLLFKKISMDDAGTYKLTATNELGETVQSAKLNIHCEKPSFVKKFDDQSVKDYDDILLKVRCDGVPKPSVTWYKDDTEIKQDDRHSVETVVGGQVDSQLAIKHFNARDAGRYVVRAANLAGEAECGSRVRLAQTAPGFAQRLERSAEADEGEPLELKCKLDGSPIPTAKWFKDGEELKPSERVKITALPDGTVKLNIECCKPSDCGAYKLLVSNPNGDASAICAVAINPSPRKPSLSQGLEDVKGFVGQPLKLEAQVMAFPAPEIKWFKDGLPIRPSQAVNFVNQPGGMIGLSIEQMKPEDAGQYTLTVTNKLGEVTSTAKVEVEQKEKKPAFLADLQPTKVVEGFPVRLEVKVVGHPPPTIKWTLNGQEIKPDGKHIKISSLPDGTHCLIIDKAKPEDAGEYGVVASNEKGESTSKAPLEVSGRGNSSSPEERPQFLHTMRDATVEEGATLVLSVPFVGNPIPDVAWSKDGVPLQPSDRVMLTCDGKRVGLEIKPAELSDAGTYSCKLVSPLGEDSTSGKANVRKVFSPPTFTQKFSDLQQLPTFDAKFPARVLGVPQPEISWYYNDKPLRHSDKYNLKRDGDACCLYVRDCKPEDSGCYKCVARNKEGEAVVEANLEVVDKIEKRQKMEPPSFLKKIGDTELYKGMTAKFTACATGSPEPEVEWLRNGEKIFPSERIRIQNEGCGLLRLCIAGVDPADVGKYSCRIYNPHGEDICHAELSYDTLEPRTRRPISDQYSEFDKMKKTGVPMPLADRPIISRMTDRHLTLSWKPSIPHGPRVPVTYQVEMCEQPDGDWFTARSGLRSCVCDIRNLEPFRDYKFRIRVENKYGISDPSPYAITFRAKLEPDPPKFIPYLDPGIDFRPETSPYFPKDFDIERPLHDGYAQAPRFLRQEHDTQYGVKNHNSNLFWFVYGYPKPKMTYYFNGEPVLPGGRYDWSYTRNGQATLFINKMLERDVGEYEAVATNEHGEARQRVRLEIAEYPTFITRPEETVIMLRKSGRMEARVTGVPYPELKWYKDWQPLAPSSRIKMQFIEPDTSILIINDAILKDEGLYSLSARNVAGAVSSSAMIHIEESEQDYSYRTYSKIPSVKPKTKPFGDFYDLGDELGRGTQGVTYHAVERLTGRNYASKIMHGHSELKPFMRNELDIMNQLNHRKLIRLHDAFEHEHTMALVMELAAGGELVKDNMLRLPHYTEGDVAGYVRQMLLGLEHMHDSNIGHLGLTIGDLLISHTGSDDLKICDFGLSRRIAYGKLANLDYGVPEYVAPEIANGEGVGLPADLWSTGIITYILLSGHSPFRGKTDRETLINIREGKWDFDDMDWWNRISSDGRDFITKLLVYKPDGRLDVKSALKHPWLTYADKMPHDAFHIPSDKLRNYYNLYRDWMSNASCRNWYRRRPLSGAFEHPSHMVYPPGHVYTPEATPERSSRSPRPPGVYENNYKTWEHPDQEIGLIKSESHYQNGPDTYLLQLRDVGFPVRLREYMKVANNRVPGFSSTVSDTYDWRKPVIRERRRFTDIMDEEIDDERKERINQYGANDNYTIRRLRHELGTRLDSYAEAEALIESKKDGQLPFFREKPQMLPIVENEPAQLTCLAVGDPKPAIQWFKNDMVIAEGNRIKIVEDEEGRSTLQFTPSMHYDVGIYKVVARNKVGQTVTRTRLVQATVPDAPDSPTAHDTSDTEILLRWKQPKDDGNTTVLCYSLQYKEGDSVDWRDIASNIDHEFYLVKDLRPNVSYQFRLSARNRIGWSEKGIPSKLFKTKESGGPKVQMTKAMKHLQQITESGQEIVLDEAKPKLNYSTEDTPIEWDPSGNLTDKYSFISELWRGKFSVVVKGADKSNDQVVVAKLLENRPETEEQIKREFECLRRLRHERIANLLAAYQAPGSPVAVLVMEKLQGADILTYLSSRHDYTEQMVATIVIQILDGLQYLHWRGYCHLDLQPDNVVMASVRSIQIKLVDFGSAYKVSKLGTTVPQVGELDYKAPEIINDEPAYPQTDIWSLGVLTYIMLSGVSPFRGADDHETKQNISFVRFRFEHLYKELSQEGTRFLMQLFKKTPQKRPFVEECYDHRWLMQSDFMIKKRERAVFLGNRLKEFSEEYHKRKSQDALQSDSVAGAFGGPSARQLTRSNSIQEELSTNF